MTGNSIARLKITLDDVKPAVLRRVEVPLAIRLDRLHLAHLSHLTARGACKPLMLLGWQRAEPICGAKAG